MEREWRCEECETLLGIDRNERLQLRYKQAQYIVNGDSYTVTAVCRNCSAVNEWRCSNEPPRPVAAS